MGARKKNFSTALKYFHGGVKIPRCCKKLGRVAKKSFNPWPVSFFFLVELYRGLYPVVVRFCIF